MPTAEKPSPKSSPPRASRGFWRTAAVRFWHNKISVTALIFVLFLTCVAMFSPAIAGTKPVICKYKGRLYFPALAYFREQWENPIFQHDKFRKVYPKKLKEKDPDSWAIWPLVYQDPERRVKRGEWPEVEFRNAAVALAALDEDKDGNLSRDELSPTSGASEKARELLARIEKADANGDGTISAEEAGAFAETTDSSEVFVVESPGNAGYAKPSRYNWLGTNKAGVDVFAQMVHGTRIALLVGFVSTGIASLIGIAVGAIAGYFGSWVDMLLSRLIEVVMCIPTLVLILALMAIIQNPTIWHLMAVLGITGWTSIARLTRAEFLKLKQSDYVSAARGLGAGQIRIMLRHILPNALSPVLVPIAFGIAGAILTEAGLSFLGFGAPPPNPSWGTLLNAGKQNLSMWWLIFFPGVAIFLTVLAYNLVAEGLQNATDPRLREAGK